MVYKWKVPGLMPVDAQTAGEEIDRLYQSKGRILPEDIVEASSIDNCRTVYAVCPECGFRTRSYHHVKFAIMQWNNRAPIVTPGRIDFLGSKKCCRTCEFSNGSEYGDDEPVDYLACRFNDGAELLVQPDCYCSYGYKERVERQ